MLARGVPEGEQRSRLLKMARIWDNLADTREELVCAYPEIEPAIVQVTGKRQSMMAAVLVPLVGILVFFAASVYLAAGYDVLVTFSTLSIPVVGVLVAIMWALNWLSASKAQK